MGVFQEYIKAQWSLHFPQLAKVLEFVPSMKAGTGTLLFCFPLGESIQG